MNDRLQVINVQYTGHGNWIPIGIISEDNKQTTIAEVLKSAGYPVEIYTGGVLVFVYSKFSNQSVARERYHLISPTDAKYTFYTQNSLVKVTLKSDSNKYVWVELKVGQTIEATLGQLIGVWDDMVSSEVIKKGLFTVLNSHKTLIPNDPKKSSDKLVDGDFQITIIDNGSSK